MEENHMYPSSLHAHLYVLVRYVWSMLYESAVWACACIFKIFPSLLLESNFISSNLQVHFYFL